MGAHSLRGHTLRSRRRAHRAEGAGEELRTRTQVHGQETRLLFELQVGPRAGGAASECSRVAGTGARTSFPRAGRGTISYHRALAEGRPPRCSRGPDGGGSSGEPGRCTGWWEWQAGRKRRGASAAPPAAGGAGGRLPSGLGAGREEEQQWVGRHSWLVAQWLERWPHHPRAQLPVKGTTLGCRFLMALVWACVAGNQPVSPSLSSFHSL